MKGFNQQQLDDHTPNNKSCKLSLDELMFFMDITGVFKIESMAWLGLFFG